MAEKSEDRQMELLQGTLDLLILKAVSLGPLHGYGVLLRIQQISGEELVIQQGSLYPALYRLEHQGVITSEWGDSENNRRAKYYRLTTAGRKRLEAETEKWNRMAGSHCGNSSHDTGELMSGQNWLGRKRAELRSWMRAAAQRRRVEREMESELEFHLESLTADLIRAGRSPHEAARQARIALGTTLTHKEGMRASLGLRWMDELGADLRYAIRMLRKSPGFTAIAAGSLALAIGANTAIFSLAKVLLYDQLQIPHPEGLKLVRWTGDDKVVAHSSWGDFDSTPDGGQTSSVFPYPIYRELSLHPAGMQSLAGFKEDGMNATVRGTARRVAVAEVTGNYYDTLQVRPQIGRAIQPSDDAVSGSGNVVVISDGLWSREFGRSPDALGQTITLNQAKLTIIGVNPPAFHGCEERAGIT